MADLKTKIEVQTISLKDIPRKSRKAPIAEEIQKIAESLALEVEEAKKKGLPQEDWPVKYLKGIKHAYLSSKVRKLQEAGKIDKSFSALKRGNDCYLIKEAV